MKPKEQTVKPTDKELDADFGQMRSGGGPEVVPLPDQPATGPFYPDSPVGDPEDYIPGIKPMKEKTGG